MAEKVRVSLEEYASWQRPVSAIETAPATSVKGDRSLVAAADATGDFLGQENNIAWHDGTAWKFDTPEEGWVVYNEADSTLYVFDGMAWGELEFGSGDMLKSVYDTDDSGVVDAAGYLDTELGCVIMEFPE